ncbi:MAG TPA: PIG-L family deacetylase [Rhizomicrobium sp.]|nr:PIG-L family deacetylase [Rhizomicrobium sp.]
MHPIESCVIETAVTFTRLMEPIGAAPSGSAALVERFRHRPVIVLSPHFDDACFSLGGFLKTLGHGILINLFTHGRYVVQPRLARADLTQDAVRYVRDKEDRAFATACGLVRHDLECEEPALRHRRPSEMAGVADDVAQIEDRLLALLFALAAESGTPSALFVPLGIGRHVNHRAAAEAILRNLARLQPFFEFYFYEELPYASNVFHRMAALERLNHRAGPVHRHVFAAPWREKRALIGLYQSQLRGTPSFTSFRPAAFPLAAHEAFWSPIQKNIKGGTPCSEIGPASS